MSAAPSSSRSAPSAAARGSYLALLGLATAVAFAPTVTWMVDRWNAPASLYGHGFLVPLVSAFLLWKDRERLRAAAGPGSWAGLGLAGLGLAMHLAAVVLRVDSMSGFGLLLVLPGWVWFTWGRPCLRVAAFPLFFLVFAVPPPMVLIDELAQVLKEWVIAGTAGSLRLFGVDVAVQGSYVLLPGGESRLRVDDECSGLRSLVALTALGTLAAGTSRSLGRLGAAVMLALAIPVALAANGVRVGVLCTLAMTSGTQTARDWHDASGWLVYGVALVAYVALELLLPRIPGLRRKAR